MYACVYVYMSVSGMLTRKSADFDVHDYVSIYTCLYVYVCNFSDRYWTAPVFLGFTHMLSFVNTPMCWMHMYTHKDIHNCANSCI